jgi:hypothetical protein
MTVYSLYIFTKRGACVYYTEWLRPVNPLRDSPEEDRKLMFGLTYSLKQLMNKMSPAAGTAADATTSQLPAFGPDQGFFRFACDGYVLFHLEAPTGTKFVLTSDAAAGDLRPALWTLYSEIYTNFAMKNPLYVPGTPISNVGFVAAVDGFIRSLPAFTAK